jgi:hypothetical protein
MMEKNTWPCPVPEEQQPLNEFRELKESGFFRWGTLDPHQYWLKVIWIWGLSWVITGPVAAASFPISKDPMHFTLCASAGASLILILLLLRLYLGWKYIGDRLNSPTVSYEESGWYDGQIWEKSPESLTQDQLIVTYQVRPILKRLHWTFAGLGTLLGTQAISWVCF